jgi:hypothetical protein
MNYQYDAQVSYAFVQSQTTYIEREVNKTVYPDIQYPALVPVDTGANPFTQTVTYYSSDQYGAARWINGNADDIPIAGTQREMKRTSVYTASIGYGYGWEEVSYAMQYGFNLEADDAAAARRAYEEMVDRVALTGDTEKGFGGLINYPSVHIMPAPNGDWPNATPDGILADINAVLLGVAQGTMYTSTADTLLMSNDRLSYIGTTRLNDMAEVTILDYLLRQNAYTQLSGNPLMVRAVRGLETAGGGGVQRLVAYRRSPQVLKMHIPMIHRFLGTFQDGPLHWVIPGVFRMGGLDIRRPGEVRYEDGI